MLLPCSTLLTLAAVAFRLASAELALINDSECGCYMTNASQASFFSTHKFFDFRNLSQYAGVPEPITSIQGSANAYATSEFFLQDEWTDTWTIQNWNNSNGSRQDASVYMQNSPNNVYIEASSDPARTTDTWLTLRTTRLPLFQTAAEIVSVSSGYQFLSMRMLARTVGAPGGCTALFTYQDSIDTTKSSTIVQEADAEFLTNGPLDRIQYTNQPSVDSSGDIIEDATRIVTMPDGLVWSDWVVHRLDWTPTTSMWYINEDKVADIKIQTPREESSIILNAWSDGGLWTGNMSLGDAAYLQVQWFEMIYNTTDPKTARKREEEEEKEADRNGCKTVCSIDSTPVRGRAVLLWTSGSDCMARLSGFTSWAPWLSVFIVFFCSATDYWQIVW